MRRNWQPIWSGAKASRATLLPMPHRRSQKKWTTFRSIATLWEEKAAASNTAIDWFQAGHYFNTVNNQHAKAIECYDKAIELKPEHTAAWNNKGGSLWSLGRYEEALRCLDRAIQLDPEHADVRFNRSELLFAMHRWDEGFDAIRDAFARTDRTSGYLGDVASMFSLIFGLSEDSSRLQSRINSLVDLYLQAVGTTPHSTQPAMNPLSYLADGLVKSLAKLDADRVTPTVLDSYVAAMGQRVGDIPEFEIPLRLFRYGIRYLVSKNEAEFVELIQPERRILRQALGLAAEGEPDMRSETDSR